MNKPATSLMRRRICLAVPAALLASSAVAFPRSYHAQRVTVVDPERSWLYEVDLTVDLFGETSKPLIQSRPGQRTTVSGVHGGKPWTLEFSINRRHHGGPLNVFTKLSSADEVFAARVVNAASGQRVIVRSDEQIYAAMVIRSA